MSASGTFVCEVEVVSGQEKRQYVRIQFERQVQLDFITDIIHDCQVENISLGGMYVHGDFPENVGEQCYVNFAQRGQNTYFFLKALARVVRQTDDGVALQFVSMSFESLMSLEMVLLYQAREESEDAEMNLPEDLPFEVVDHAPGVPEEVNPFLDLTE